MPSTVEKIRVVDIAHDAIEHYLRTNVLKIYDASLSDSSDFVPIEDFFEPLIAQYAKEK